MRQEKAKAAVAVAADAKKGSGLPDLPGAKLGVAVFARTPGSGGKSRLAAGWGRQRTDLLYLHCLRCAAEWLQRGRSRAAVYWALTGAGQRQDDIWREIPILEQREGGLGERMADIACRLMHHHSCWCLVGTDIPQLPSLASLEISRRLKNADYVFGPSSDGGFWLMAGRCLPRCKVWTQVRYSQPDTLTQLVDNIRRDDVHVVIDAQLPMLTDVDLAPDVAALRQSLVAERSGAGLTPAQEQLLQWLAGGAAE